MTDKSTVRIQVDAVGDLLQEVVRARSMGRSSETSPIMCACHTAPTVNVSSAAKPNPA